MNSVGRERKDHWTVTLEWQGQKWSAMSKKTGSNSKQTKKSTAPENPLMQFPFPYLKGKRMLKSSFLCSLLLSSCSVVSASLWPMDGSTPGFPVLHHLLEFTQTHVHHPTNFSSSVIPHAAYQSEGPFLQATVEAHLCYRAHRHVNATAFILLLGLCLDTLTV